MNVKPITKTTLAISMPLELADAIRRRANRQDRPLCRVVIELLEKGLHRGHGVHGNVADCGASASRSVCHARKTGPRVSARVQK